MERLRLLTAGESHGPELTAIIEGIPAGLEITEGLINTDLRRRQVGYGRGGRMRIESDAVRISAGVRHGRTLGGPVCVSIANRDWPNWQEEMSAQEPGPGWRSGRVVRTPRPGHADLAGAARFCHRDMRNVLERASARETAARVAAGAVCRALLAELGVTVRSCVTSIGGITAEPGQRDAALWDSVEASDLRVGVPASEPAMREAIDRARASGDTLGGRFVVEAAGLPPGLGSYTHWDRRLDAALAAAVMSIPGVKAVELGEGFALADVPGSDAHDEIAIGECGGAWPLRRLSNRAGGVEGGVTNGEPVVVRAAMKPIPTLTRTLRSVSLDGLRETSAHAERSDVCAVPAAAVVGEAMVCLILADAALAAFGGGTVGDVRAARDRWVARLRALWEAPGEGGFGGGHETQS